MIFYGLNKDVVQFAADILQLFGTNSVLTTIITVGKYEDCFALIVIDTWLVDIVEKKAPYYSLKRMNTSSRNTPDG